MNRKFELTLGKIHRAQNNPDFLRESGCRHLVKFESATWPVSIQELPTGLIVKSIGTMPWYSVWKILKQRISACESLHNLKCALFQEDREICLYVFFSI